jgi:hypothetical protein
MNETQQILNAIRDVEIRLMARLDSLEDGQKSIRSEMATKADLQSTRKELTAKIDAVKADTEAIRASLDTGTGSLYDDIKFLYYKVGKIEKNQQNKPK